ncbi:MAG: homocysteine S-methyltransferase family protein [Kiritimatiellae bacterium]|jgi:5-methyltetrahydrofolate--homocysteine methyltransferase|nr:homocysteine S-methyltransferase family protein [Kiritimatiellia bacterium]
MMRRIIEELRDKKVMFSDGAWGTMMQEMGLEPGACPDEWSLSHKDEVYSIAKAYIDAGSDMVETNSFGASSFKLQHFGLEDRAYEINKAAAELSRSAAGEDKHVIGSMGPTGKLLLMGDVTEEELYESFKEQAMGLEAGGADACCIETFSAVDEAVIAIQAVKENTNLEIITTFTFEETVNGDYRTMMGVSPEQMVEEIVAAGADIVGTNCGNGMGKMVAIVKAIRSANADIPILVHGNAGMPKNVEGNVVFPESPEEMANVVVSVVEAGANIVGGCCGTTPKHIAAMVASCSINN